MHFDFIAEGWKPDLDAFEEWMNTRTFPLPCTYPDGSVKIAQAPAALRPRRFYTYVFPKGSLDIVLNSLKPQTSLGLHDGKGTPIFKTATEFLRKGLRLKKIPKPDISKGEFPLVMKNIRLLGLGIREDIDINQNGIIHEGL